MSDHEERAEDGRRERAEDKADRRGVPEVCELCRGKGGFEWNRHAQPPCWEAALCPECGVLPKPGTPLPPDLK